MTVYRKCRPCKHRGNCDEQKKISAAIRGLGVSSLMHSCKKFEPMLARGEHVIVRTYAHGNDSDDYGNHYGAPLAEFPAVFVSFHKSLGKAIVYIGKGTKSVCGTYEFEPVGDNRGFCRVSFGPLSAKFKWRQKGIIERREGKTELMDCCDLPVGNPCEQCSRNSELLS